MYKSILLVFMSVSLFAEIQNNFNYQAIAIDGGVPVSNTNIAIQFKVSEIGGTVIYTEKNEAVATDNRGFFNLIVGNNTVVSGTLDSSDFNRPLKLVIEADYNITDGVTYTLMGESEFTSVPYAIGAKTGGGFIGDIKTSILNFTLFAPLVGDSTTFNATTSQWAPANGSNITGSKYATLTGLTTLPDLRGMFLRGRNNFGISTRSDGLQDPDGVRTAGSYQADQFKAHYHVQGYDASAISGKYGREDTGSASGRYDHSDTNSASGTLGSKTSTVGSTETRSKNVAVYYYIKIN